MLMQKGKMKKRLGQKHTQNFEQKEVLLATPPTDIAFFQSKNTLAEDRK